MEVVFVEDKTEDQGRMAFIHGMPSTATTVITKIPEGINGFCKVGIYTTNDTTYLGAGTVFSVYGVRA